jgi:hypothetical protein
MENEPSSSIASASRTSSGVSDCKARIIDIFSGGVRIRATHAAKSSRTGFWAGKPGVITVGMLAKIRRMQIRDALSVREIERYTDYPETPSADGGRRCATHSGRN